MVGGVGFEVGCDSPPDGINAENNDMMPPGVVDTGRGVGWAVMTWIFFSWATVLVMKNCISSSGGGSWVSCVCVSSTGDRITQPGVGCHDMVVHQLCQCTSLGGAWV